MREYIIIGNDDESDPVPVDTPEQIRDAERQLYEIGQPRADVWVGDAPDAYANGSHIYARRSFRCERCGEWRDADRATEAPCASCGVCAVCAPTHGGYGSSDICAECGGTTAEGVAERFDNDGLAFALADGTDLGTHCEALAARIYRRGDLAKYVFGDGSGIVTTPAGWDVALTTEPGCFCFAGTGHAQDCGDTR